MNGEQNAVQDKPLEPIDVFTREKFDCVATMMNDVVGSINDLFSKMKDLHLYIKEFIDELETRDIIQNRPSWLPDDLILKNSKDQDKETPIAKVHPKPNAENRGPSNKMPEKLIQRKRMPLPMQPLKSELMVLLPIAEKPMPVEEIIEFLSDAEGQDMAYRLDRCYRALREIMFKDKDWRVKMIMENGIPKYYWETGS